MDVGRRVHISSNLLMIWLLLASLFIVINAEIESTAEVEDEHTFTYSSNTSNGPEHWGDLNPKWKTCKNGKLQSPIDLLNNRVEVASTLGTLRRTYKPADAVLKNRGHDIMVKWKGDAGGAVINGSDYKLLQCHWHTPSEHAIGGRKYNMELHMVHKSSQGQLAVIGIMYTYGHPDTFLDMLLEHVGSVGGEIELGSVDPWEIKFGSREYYRYIGSLTTPPCTEGVVWTLLKKVRTVSREQIKALRRAVDDGFERNARPTQPLDKRSVYMFRPQSP